MTYVGDSFGGASALFNADQEARRRAGQESTRQVIDAIQRRTALAQNQNQFQQDLAARLQMSKDAQERMALQRAMQLQYQEENLRNREQAVDQRGRQIDSGEADKKHTTRYNAGLFEAQNGTYDPDNYSDLPKEERDFLGRIHSASQKPVESAYNTAGYLADRANIYNRLKTDINTPPVTAGGSHWYNPLTWLNSSAAPSQPSDRAIAMRNQLAMAMPGFINQGVNSGDITQNPVTGAYANTAPVPANIRYVPKLPPPSSDQVGALSSGAGPVNDSLAGRINQFTHPLTAARYPGDNVPMVTRDSLNSTEAGLNKDWDQWYKMNMDIRKLRAMDVAADTGQVGNIQGLDSISGTPASAGRTITDRSGKKWIYRGTMDDPRMDKDPANWQSQ